MALGAEILFVAPALVAGYVLGARRAGAALRRLAETSRTDLLTGVLNDRGFEERFGVERQRTERGGRPFAVILGDLDHFSALNDRFGRAGGDEALEAAAAALRDAVRGVDAVGRVGGEEFAIVVPDTDADGGVILAERLRALVPRVTHTTMSFGVAEYPRDGAELKTVLRAADRALSEAKAGGRDRVVAYTPAPAPPRPAPAANREAPSAAAM